mgnify:CR=1 FL=1
MSNQYSVAEFVEAFKQFYQTIDVRVALLKHENQWRIVCMALRIHIASVSIIEREFKKLKTCFGKMVSPRFRIIQRCYSFSELDNLTDAFSKGYLIFEKVGKIRFDEKRNILGLRGHIPWFSGSGNKADSMNWPVLQANLQLSAWDGLHQLLQGDSEILRDVEVAGYYDPYSVVKQLLDVDFASSTSGSYLWLECDVPARIDSIKASRSNVDNITLTIYITAHKALSNLSCNIRKKRTASNGQPLQQKVLPLKLGKTKSGLQEWTGQLELNTDVDDQFDIELVYRNIGRLHSQGIRPLELLRVEERNPLFMALQRFCPLEQIRDLLEHPEVIEASKNNVGQVSLKNKGRLYEVSVQWLLSSLGLRAIWLHGYEKMKTENYDYGSVDCLAYHELRNILLLVNCTTAPPDQHEINRLMELQHRLSDDTFKNTAVRLYSVLFTASNRPGVKQGVFTNANMRIFYREDIPKMLALVEKGQEIQFIDVIINTLLPRL